MTAAIGTLSQLGIDSANPVTKRFDFVTENVVDLMQPIDASGVRGTRGHTIDRIRASLQRIGGTIVLQPNAVELALLLPWILGGTSSGSPTVTYTFAETVPGRYITVDRISKVFTYAGCAVDSATFSSAPGQPLTLELNVVGLTETVANSGTFPAINIDVTNGPFILSDMSAGLTVNATANVTCQSWRFTISNGINRERFFNSLTLVSADAWDRHVALSMTVPYGDWNSFYNLGTAGVSVNSVFTYGNAVLTITCPKVVFTQHSPAVPGRAELFLQLDGIAYAQGGASPVNEASVISLNPGP